MDVGSIGGGAPSLPAGPVVGADAGAALGAELGAAISAPAPDMPQDQIILSPDAQAAAPPASQGAPDLSQLPGAQSQGAPDVGPDLGQLPGPPAGDAADTPQLPAAPGQSVGISAPPPTSSGPVPADDSDIDPSMGTPQDVPDDAPDSGQAPPAPTQGAAPGNTFAALQQSGDPVAGAAMDELQQRAPDAETLSPTGGSNYQTGSGFQVQLQGQGYTLSRPQDGELHVRQFDPNGQLTSSLDQTREPQTNGSLTLTQQRTIDPQTQDESRVTQQVRQGMDVASTPDDVKQTGGFEKFQTQVQQDASPSVNYAHVQQEQIPAQAQAGLTQAAAAEGAVYNLSQLDLEVVLPREGELHVLQAESGLLMQVVVPKQGKKLITIRSKSGALLYQEEEEEETDEHGNVVRRRTIWDRSGRTRRYVEVRQRNGRVYRQEDNRSWHTSSELTGTPVKTASRTVRRLSGDFVECVEEHCAGDSSRRTVTRQQGDDVTFEESRTKQTSPGRVVESATRTDLRRGRQGQEDVLTTPERTEKTARWMDRQTTCLEYRVESEKRHRVVTYNQPERSQGEVVTHYAEGQDAAVRLIRRSATSARPVADLVGPAARPYLAGRAEDPDCLQVDLTRQTSVRWELLESPRWVLQEDTDVYDTRGTWQGGQTFVDRLTRRRFPGFGGTLHTALEISSERRNQEGVCESRCGLHSLDGVLQVEAHGSTSRLTRAEVVRQVDDPLGLTLLKSLTDPFIVTTMLARHVESESRQMVQMMADGRRTVGRFGSVSWWLQAAASTQAFRSSTRNTAWAERRPGRTDLQVDMPDGREPRTARLRESVVERGRDTDLAGLLQAHGLPDCETLIESNLLEPFERRMDLALRVGTLQGERAGHTHGGARISIQTPEGDILVLLVHQGQRAFGYLRRREGSEIFSIPHSTDRNQRLELTCDEEGVFGDYWLYNRSTSLGRLGEAFGGLLFWIQSGRPLQRPGQDLPAGFADSLSDMASGLRGLGRGTVSDADLVRSALWDFSRLAWGQTGSPLSQDEEATLRMLLASGLPPVETLCLVLTASSDATPEEGRIPPMHILTAEETAVDLG